MNKVLITGVAGFIGSRVASRFMQQGYRVIGVDDLSTGNIENIPPGITFIEADLAKDSTIKKLPSDCRKILHLAGQSSGEISFDDPIADLEKNTVSTLNLIRFGVENHIERFVYASSMAVYGRVEDHPIDENQAPLPISCYGVGKLAAEGYLRTYSASLPFVIMRMFNVYGPGQDLLNMRQGMVSIYLAQALKNRLIEVKGNINRFRDFIYIDDVVEAWYKASLSTSSIGKTFNVGTGMRTTVAQLLEIIRDNVPGCEYFVTGGTPGDQDGIYADTTKIRECLTLNAPVPLELGIKKFCEAVSGLSFFPEGRR